jgi:hypothetical protein
MTALFSRPPINLDLLNYRALNDLGDYLPACSPEERMNAALEFYLSTSKSKKISPQANIVDLLKMRGDVDVELELPSRRQGWIENRDLDLG